MIREQEGVSEMETQEKIISAQPDVLSDVIKIGPSISWRAIFAGAFISFLVFFLLTALGVGILGGALQRAIRSESVGEGFTWGAGIWLIVSAFISLFAGSYLGARCSGIIPTRVGGVQGLVIAALFFAVAIGQMVAAVGTVGRAAERAAGLGSAVLDMAQNPRIQGIVERGLANMRLKSPPGEVVSGVIGRLMRGDTDAAVAYLERETGMTAADLTRRVQEFRAEVRNTAKEVAIGATNATRAAGWAVFISVLGGSICALFGGGLGARRNIRRPLSEADKKVALDAEAAWVAARTHVPPPVRG
jgi:hypothetical protein